MSTIQIPQDFWNLVGFPSTDDEKSVSAVKFPSSKNEMLANYNYYLDYIQICHQTSR